MKHRLIAIGVTVLLALAGLVWGGGPSAHASPSTCTKVKFIGVRGSGEKVTEAPLGMGPTVYDTFTAFRDSVPKGVAVEGVGLDYPASQVAPIKDPLKPSLFVDALFAQQAPSVLEGTANLTSLLLPYIQKDTATCLVLAGYSQGAWVIDKYFYDNPAITARLLDRITAVVLFGDPEFDPKSNVVTGGAVGYPGVGRSGFIPASMRWPTTGMYYAGQANRVKSICHNADPVCAWNTSGDPYVPGPGPQSDLSRIVACVEFAPSCPHLRYGADGYVGYAGDWAAGRVKAAVGPAITGTSTFTQGVLVFARVSYSSDAVGFGFQGIKGSGWARETHPFTSPSYGRVYPDHHVEYPFNHSCGTPQAYQSDIEFWVYDAAGRESPHVPIHLAC